MHTAYTQPAAAAATAASARFARPLGVARKDLTSSRGVERDRARPHQPRLAQLLARYARVLVDEALASIALVSAVCVCLRRWKCWPGRTKAVLCRDEAGRTVQAAVTTRFHETVGSGGARGFKECMPPLKIHAPPPLIL